jgi:cell division protein ZapA (FtsZ GTPase activity inhibitor)
MSDLIAINIVIGDRSYRIKIDPKDEETVRRTLKLINDKIIEFKTNFSGKDMQDYVAMVLAWFATDQQKTTVAPALSSAAAEKLQLVQQLLDDALQPPQ